MEDIKNAVEKLINNTNQIKAPAKLHGKWEEFNWRQVRLGESISFTDEDRRRLELMQDRDIEGSYYMSSGHTKSEAKYLSHIPIGDAEKIEVEGYSFANHPLLPLHDQAIIMLKHAYEIAPSAFIKGVFLLSLEAQSLFPQMKELWEQMSKSQRNFVNRKFWKEIYE